MVYGRMTNQALLLEDQICFEFLWSVYRLNNFIAKLLINLQTSSTSSRPHEVTDFRMLTGLHFDCQVVLFALYFVNSE